MEKYIQYQNWNELVSFLVLSNFRFYLLGGEFLIETDNLALTTILINKCGNSRAHRWSLLLQEYTFENKHFSGFVADAITRVEQEDTIHSNIKIGVNFIIHSVEIYSLREIEGDRINLNREQNV